MPDTISAAIAALDSDTFLISVVRKISPAEKHLFAHILSGAFTDGERVITPSASTGIWSERNLFGWEVVRKDLPMVKKTFYWETPNFGDASRYGTHTHLRVRDVYQKEYFDGRNFSLRIQPIKQSPVDGTEVYQFSVISPFDRLSLDQTGLLMAVNLLQENCGAVGVISSTASRADIAATIVLDWEVFPPGSSAELISSFSKGRKVPPTGLVEDRVKMFSLLKPKAFLRGSGGLGSYIGAQYADDLVVFENLEYGNALYILYEDWQEASKRSRYELIRGTDANYDRLPHTFGWQKAFRQVMARERKRRGLV